MDSPSAELVTGRLGLGAVVLLAGFLAVDSRNIGAFDLVESYGDTAAWGIIIAAPTLLISYILGVLCVGTAEATIGRLRALGHARDTHALLAVADANDLIRSTFVELVRRRELLEGATVAFTLLAIGCVADAPQLPGSAVLSIVLIGIAIVLVAMCFMFAVRTAGRIRRIVGALEPAE